MEECYAEQSYKVCAGGIYGAVWIVRSVGAHLNVVRVEGASIMTV